MSYRRRHRWLRRLARGLAFATALAVVTASSALGSLDEGGAAAGPSALEARVVDDKWNISQPSSGPASVRPDDGADRFAHSDVASRPQPAGDGWTFEPVDVLMVGIGGLALTIGLGLALGALRRPRIVGP
jgi:hypothetical protein